MPLVLLAFIVFTILLGIALTPLTLVLRCRRGTVTRRAREWAVVVNIVAIALSTAMLLAGAAITSFWVPGAFWATGIGLVVGSVLGHVGLALTRWEAGGGTLHYTPNRRLVLAITLTVTARLLFGFWRSWQAWAASSDRLSWIVASGAAGSMAAGAVVLGYYLAYWMGVRRRVRLVREGSARLARR
ncbi:MAG TPA: hypothetical protein VNK41_10620 [Vicinamibacterales bacterium]|nr:hypothetical protein [Vicinamibacterales bacterium]